MEWLERMNRAIDYIEANLTGEIELREAARMACCSSYQFQRMFSFITDVTLAEYIRRRRLTLAALELQHGGAAKVDRCRAEVRLRIASLVLAGVPCAAWDHAGHGPSGGDCAQSLPPSVLPYHNQRGRGNELSDRNEGKL
ncbi:hypothetical protein [Paenibacillus ehimensis]|uniref:hypothetical protein n=1 Tax=Paenibacillus ehimensis TaxID=79264 RepID=UPI0034E2CD79